MVESAWADWIKLRRTYRYLYRSYKTGNVTDILLLTSGTNVYVDVFAVKQYLRAMKLSYNSPFLVSNLMVYLGTVHVGSSPGTDKQI